jgi:hypothetical protein
MWSLFKPFANLIDRSPDDGVDEVLGGAYSKALGVLGWVFLCVMVATLFVGVTWWRGSIFKPVEYLSVDPEKQTKKMITQSSPAYSGTRIQSWVARVIAETLTFNFVDIDDKIGRSDAYYTPDAAAAMRGSLTANGVLDTVKKSRLRVTVTPLFSPRVVDFLNINGENTWVVEAPILLTYTSASSRETKSLMVTVRVKAADPALNPDGLVVSGFFTSSYTY